MRICCLTYSLSMGGAVRQMVVLAETLARQGHSVELIYYHPGKGFYHLPEVPGLTATLIEKKGGSLRLLRDMKRHLTANPCDLMIAFPAGPCTKACALHAVHPHFKLVVSERNCNIRMLPTDSIRFAMYSQADKVVCNSHAQEEFIRKHYPTLSDKLLTVTNFIDSDTFKPADSDNATQDIHCNGARRIIVTARVCRRKNVHGLIKAAALLRDRGVQFSIDWYGLMRENRYFRRCIRTIEKAGLDGSFRILRASGDVAGLYRQYDIFALPSFYEGTSNSLAEALASGMTIVCSDVSDNHLYVREGANGFLCNASDPSSIADALQKALTLDNEAMKRFGTVSRQAAVSLLSRDRYESSYRALMSELL